MMINDVKHWVRDLFKYPPYNSPDELYDTYWGSRDMEAPLNSFQRARADFIIEKVRSGDTVLDVGCGDGRILAELSRCVPGIHVVGLDNSVAALSRAKSRGITVFQADIRNSGNLRADPVDWVLLLEVLEHMPDSEALLAWAVRHAHRGVVFSVPNTGFIVHRLRLLFGSFPLQWKAHPSEHLRFWTIRDMVWWLRALGYHSEIHTYEGVPLLKRLWPSLFAAGIIVIIKPVV